MEGILFLTNTKIKDSQTFSRIEFKILLLVYKCVHGLAPAYLKYTLTLYKPYRSLHSADGLLLEEPRCRLVTCGDRAFACAAPRLWNKLPQKLRSVKFKGLVAS
jgi:hypothetical protein